MTYTLSYDPTHDEWVATAGEREARFETNAQALTWLAGVMLGDDDA